MAQSQRKQFYNSIAWRNVRREVLRRDHYNCRDCMSHRAEEVHHIISLNATNINDQRVSLNPDNLISLCVSCHTKRTNGAVSDAPDGYVFDDDGQVIPG